MCPCIIYIYIYIYIYAVKCLVSSKSKIFIHTHISSYIHTHTQVWAAASLSQHLDMYIRTYIHTCIHIFIQDWAAASLSQHHARPRYFARRRQSWSGYGTSAGVTYAIYGRAQSLFKVCVFCVWIITCTCPHLNTCIHACIHTYLRDLQKSSTTF